MKRLIIILMILYSILLAGCQSNKSHYIEHSLFNGGLNISLPEELQTWEKEDIVDEFEGREIPKYVFSDDDQDIQVDIVETNFSVEEFSLELLHNFRIQRLESLDSISSINDDGIIELNSHQMSQIRYYNHEKEYEVHYLITNLQSKIIYIRIIYHDDYNEYWMRHKDDILYSIKIDD